MTGRRGLVERPWMDPRDLWTEALAGVLARPVRSALTTLGTVLGITTLVITIGVASTAGNQIVGRFDALTATSVTVTVPAPLPGEEDAGPRVPWSGRELDRGDPGRDAPVRARRWRRYTTGQSMGAMMSLGLNIKYPDLFAAAFIVAGQWPEAQAAPLAQKDLWIVVSADDTKACPGEQAITAVIQEQGTQVSTALWDGQSTAAGFAADVRGMKAQRTPVNFAAFETGTVVPTGSTTSAHMATWQVAYTIPGIRDWIMRQSS
ncbi:hypothetical protein [Streptomyces sp. STR69]|uniref:hypothetical protein n=1 Tax=Streptomyces sp. STR69 TaxID=1796942 RepID=UPI0021C94479|nr:hypothetical protein [Streptomyces sp. STR69]